MLVCPLCRATVVEGAEPVSGTCPGCGAQFAGGGDDARAGVAAALSSWQIADLDPDRVSDGLFRILPTDPLNQRVTVTSDRRDAFYRWWVFVCADAVPAEVLGEAATYAP